MSIELEPKNNTYTETILGFLRPNYRIFIGRFDTVLFKRVAKMSFAICEQNVYISDHFVHINLILLNLHETVYTKINPRQASGTSRLF